MHRSAWKGVSPNFAQTAFSEVAPGFVTDHPWSVSQLGTDEFWPYMGKVGKGMSVNQRTLDEVVLAYIEAWSTPDEAVRRQLLDVSLADDASYTDPAYELRGKEEIASHIGRSLNGEAYDGAGAGARIPISSGVDQHHGMLRFSWVMIEPRERQILLEGMDFVELAADGRLQHISGYFGAFPPIPESWPEHLVWRGG
jgi:hypothetical protein